MGNKAVDSRDVHAILITSTILMNEICEFSYPATESYNTYQYLPFSLPNIPELPPSSTSLPPSYLTFIRPGIPPLGFAAPLKICQA